MALLLPLLAVALSLIMILAWYIAGRTGRSGWIDAIWSFATGGVGAIGALVPVTDAAPSARQWLVAVLACLWAGRLGLHILERTLTGADDPRYVQLAREWGADFRRRLFWFLQIQAAASCLLVASILIAARAPAPDWRWNDGLGVAVLVVAVLGEALADRQLRRFRADPAHHGEICDTGLWAWSRHPNYFFEWLGWLGYPLIAIEGSAYPWGWLALAGPVFMYWLLVHVSGVPPLEAHMLRSRGTRFQAYEARVNAFWPGPPRRSSP